jgi:cation-transporting ATPase I
VRAIEDAHGISDGEPFVSHPDDPGPVVRRGIELTAAVLAAGLGLAANVVRAPIVPTHVSSLASLADNTPAVRRWVERRLGAVHAELVIHAANVVAGGRDRRVWRAAGVSAAALLGLVEMPVTSGFFGSRPVGPIGLAIAGGSTAVATAVALVMARRPLAATPAASPAATG